MGLKAALRALEVISASKTASTNAMSALLVTNNLTCLVVSRRDRSVGRYRLPGPACTVLPGSASSWTMRRSPPRVGDSNRDVQH